MKIQPIDELKKRLVEVAHLSSIMNLLFWDQDVNMPPKGADARAASISRLSGIVHEKFLAINNDGLLTKLKKELDGKKLRGKDAVIVRETWRSFERTSKLPSEFVSEMSEVTSKSQTVWAEARKKNDFKMFLPWLEKVVALKRREAEYIGYKDSPYDALIDAYEPGMTTSEAAKILNDLKDFLTPFIQKINKSKQKKFQIKKKKFPIDQQEVFNKYMASAIGFDFEAGRLDQSTHPFSSSLHPQDSRMTTRYREEDPMYSIGSLVHESGHALYEQGLPAEHFGTPLAEAVSLGIHESQSRMWENLIGKSKEFWKYFYPKLQKEFKGVFDHLSLDDFYKMINEVKPSLVRTESDEVTYNLHIIARFEIEREMIEGSVELKDLPKIWKSKMKDYLGVDVPSDTLGVLQDVHWSAGLMGYFPTYSFGNLYSAQFYAKMKEEIPGLSGKIAKGQFTEIKDWLRKNIHSKGKTYTAGDLVKKVTGEALNSRYFAEYLEKKYGGLYSL